MPHGKGFILFFSNKHGKKQEEKGVLCFERPGCSVEEGLGRKPLRSLACVGWEGLQEKELKVINPAVAFT